MRVLTQRVVQSKHGPVRELIALRPFTARLADGRFRFGKAEGASLAALFLATGKTVGPLTTDTARCAERFDDAADCLETAPSDAQLIARDAVIELAELAPFIVRAGARPRVETIDFDGVARLIRAGETAMALGLAQESLARLAAQLGTPALDPPQQRPQQIFDGWFSMDADRILAADRATADLGGPIEGLDSVNAQTGFPVVGGTGCPRIFGSASQWRCNCGRAVNSGHCRRCGIQPGTLARRDTTFARVDLKAPCLHPGLMGRIASALDLDEDAVRALIASSTPSATFADDEPPSEMIELLKESAPELLITCVPVVPPGDRAMRAVPGEADIWAVFEHAIDKALRALIDRAARLRRLVELGIMPEIVRFETFELKKAFVAYFEAVRAGHATTGLGSSPAPEAR